MKKTLEAIGALTGLFTAVPIWLYLLHWILKTNSAGDLQMFLFWIYLPLSIIITIIFGVAKCVDE